MTCCNTLRVIAAALVVALLGPTGPAQSPPTGLESTPLADRGEATGGPLFQSLPAKRTGLDFAYRWNPPPRYEGELANSIVASGVCIGDYDGDGRPDVVLTRSAGGLRLYRNLGDFRFEDATARAGLSGDTAWSTGASFADVDGDGDLDLHVCGYDTPNRLYINQGDGTFQERARAFGLDFKGSSVMMAFADYDGDGDLDGYLLTNRYNIVANGTEVKFTVSDRGKATLLDPAHREFLNPIVLDGGRVVECATGQADHLYRNNGDGTFTDVSEKAGLEGFSHGLGVVWWDYNGDGRPDIYVANDYFGPDCLYRNNGDGTFTDVIKEAVGQTPWYSMGTDFGDLNNDGRLDLLATDMAGTTHYKSKIAMGDMSEQAWFLTWPEPRQAMKNCLFVNTGTPRFMEAAFLAGLASSDWTWTVKLADLDNDGRLDVFLSNGMTRAWMNSDLRAEAAKRGPPRSPEVLAFWREQASRRDTNMAFRNLGDFRFRNVATAWGLDHTGVSFGAALGDLDGDGDLDLVVNNFEEPAGVYRNTGTKGHRILVALRGTRSNRHGLGARISVQTASGRQVRYLSPARGFMSSNEPVVHLGLGDDMRLERLVVEWPSGHRQTFEDLPADRRYTVTEPDGPPPARPVPAPPPTMFARHAALEMLRHRERPFPDFEVQSLLPNKLSQLGPGLAWGDVNGDGLDDVYLGGAAGQFGMLLLAKPGGGFRWGPNVPFSRDRGSADMAPLFLDADLDGDLDLFVVSGGYHAPPGHPVYRDRLYLNDNGRGKFVSAPAGRIPALADSGSTAVAADFDRDGDLDLFVGGRVVPGDYPTPPRSRLLRNDRGTFSDVTEELAPELGGCGMVTGAIWSDATGDGWLDLLVTVEYGPVRLFVNRKGRLEDRTATAGLADRTGWWNAVAARDVDHDGDIDYAVMNFGLNTKYHPSPLTPQRIYYADFDKTGKKKIVEAKCKGPGILPVRGKSCSQNAMPFIREKFPHFHDFASADATAIYGKKALDEAFRLEANTLESGILINDGEGRFTFRPLPRIAQVAPGFGVAFLEADGDGHPDLYLVQNFYHPQPETPRMDGGVSLLLRGDGTGRFLPVWPDRSGLVVPGDAKALTVTDLNGDGWEDLVVTVNDGHVVAFENRGVPEHRLLRVRLEGRTGNRAAVGARVRLKLADSATRTAEVYSGGGYLSQSSRVLTFGLGRDGRVEAIEVRWPDGTTTTHRPEAGAGEVVLRRGDG